LETVVAYSGLKGLPLTNVTVCGKCGAVSLAGVSFCFACGGSLTSNVPAGVSPGQPPTPYAPVPPVSAVPPQFPPPQFAPTPFGQFAPPSGYNAAGPVPNAAARPTGITILAVAEVVTAVITLLVAIDLLRWAYTDFYYDDFKWVVIDGGLGLVYGAVSLTAFSVARGIWFVQPWAWKKAGIVSLSLLGIVVASVFAWGPTGLDLFGVVGQMSILAYLSLSSVRVLFGRSATTLFEGPR
jgi:hypothetical protein